MQPLHAVEYEVTSELATALNRAAVRLELRRGWRRDVPTYLGAAVFAALIVWLGLAGLLMPAYGAGLLCLVALFVFGAVYRRWAIARGAGVTLLVALHSTDHRVRVEFDEERLRL